MRFSDASRRAAATALLGIALIPGLASGTPIARSGVDLTSIDHTCKACDDFYQFADGAWLAHTVIPADKSRYAAFDILHDKNEAVLHEILDEAVKSSPPP